MAKASRDGNNPPTGRDEGKITKIKRPRENLRINEVYTTASSTKRSKKLEHEDNYIQQTEEGSRPRVQSAFAEDEVTGVTNDLNEMPVRDKDRDHKSGIESSLAPLSDITHIFAEMTDTALSHGLLKVVHHLEGKVLRVATVCSGTESPILALKEICNHLKKLHKNLQFRHVFSAEIEPYKQQYIERNFQPPFLFRDVREVALNAEATTAYGAPSAVPQDVDLVVAGFACVDFSSLNQRKKVLEESGESGDTLRAILIYAKKYNPPLVLIENVIGAPWSRIERSWAGIGYRALHLELDTKQYYIPQTRNRGYMVCINQERMGSQALQTALSDWMLFMKGFKRPASSPLTDFLLEPGDPRLEEATVEMSRTYDQAEKSRKISSWAVCHERYLAYRDAQRLGNRRPFTEWQENGPCKMPDWANRTWVNAQVDRVKDTIDVAFLRGARRGFDLGYKMRVLDLSQNVDFNQDSTPFGLTGCITPSGMPFLTNRGGPITGIEVLKLQGLPVDRIHLTRESQRELQDLAGNAMSATVVGAAILSTLICGYSALSPPIRESDIDTHTKSIKAPEGLNIPTKMKFLSPRGYRPRTLDELCKRAKQSAQLCHCEGEFGVMLRKFFVCSDCSHKACEHCYGIPSHNYVELDSSIVNARLQPHTYIKELKESLPMRVKLKIPDSADLNVICANAKKVQRIEEFYSCVKSALNDELRFRYATRTESWTAVYESLNGRLELELADRAHWYLYAIVPVSEPANSVLREQLQRPVAQMSPVSQDILEGVWQLRSPMEHEFVISIEGFGIPKPSRRAILGLEDYQDEMVWPTLQIENANRNLALHSDITGKYIWLHKCGTAHGALHARSSENGKDPLYLFLDPGLVSDPTEDCFVFSYDNRRSVKHSSRKVEALVGRKKGRASVEKWRPSSEEGKQIVRCLAREKWVSAHNIHFEIVSEELVQYAVPLSVYADASPGNLLEAGRSCVGAEKVVLSCRVPLSTEEEVGWSRGDWIKVDQWNERNFYSSMTWLTDRVKLLSAIPVAWRQMKLSKSYCPCGTCTPQRPSIKWAQSTGSGPIKLIPYEDNKEAINYERLIKARPSPFTTYVRIDDGLNGNMVIHANVTTLAHRALERFGKVDDPKQYCMEWRLDTSHIAHLRRDFGQFLIPNNRENNPLKHIFVTSQKKLQLQPQQERSLDWMIKQEQHQGTVFEEEEVEEASIPSLGWRMEARARKIIYIRGGVLADGAGYGKTVTTLALIDRQSRSDENLANGLKLKGKISTKATLIIVPSTLVRQWESEIVKFLGSAVKTVYLRTTKDLLNTTVADFKAANIIVMSWTILVQDQYLTRLAHFSAVPEPPRSTDERAFRAWLRKAISQSETHVEELKTLAHLKNYAESLKSRLEAIEADEELSALLPSKRFKGQAYSRSKTNVGSPWTLENVTESSDTVASNVTKFSNFGFGSANSLDDINGPLIEMFEFGRLVVDEYTYLERRAYSSTISLAARSRWILSATPRLGDFADVKVIASFLHINLGRDDDTGKFLSGQNLRLAQKDRTAVEKFQSYRRLWSPTWHENRIRHAQNFLDTFVRQNFPNLDEVSCSEEVRYVTLPGAQYSTYLELQMQLRAQDMKSKKGKRSKFDDERNERLNRLLSTSQTPQEALVIAAASFELEENKLMADSAKNATGLIWDRRCEELSELVSQLKETLAEAMAIKWRVKAADRHFSRWNQHIKGRNLGDNEVCMEIEHLIQKADRFTKKHPLPAELENKTERDQVRVLRRKAELLFSLAREYVARARTLRFFRTLCLVQETCWDATGRYAASDLLPHCGCLERKAKNLSILSICGHTVCAKCLEEVRQMEGSQCIVDGCDASSAKFLTVPFEDLRSVQSNAIHEVSYHGQKIDDVVALIKDILSGKEESIIIFVQFEQLMRKLSRVLDLHDVAHFATTKKEIERDDGLGIMIENFKSGERRVLMLNSSNETCAGANLTRANHLIFVSPFLTPSQYEYDASDHQCLARARRFGQLRHVKVYRFLSLKTIDVDIIQERTGQKLVKHSEDFFLKPQDSLAEHEKQQSWGADFHKVFNANADEARV